MFNKKHLDLNYNVYFIRQFMSEKSEGFKGSSIEILKSSI